MQSQSRLSSERLAVFCLEMGMLIRSGVNVSTALNALEADAGSTAERELYQRLHLQMEEGASFSEALASAGAFPDVLIQMIQLGVESGDLSPILDSLHSYYTKEDELEKEVKNACTYPLIMMVIMTAVLFLVVFKVLPIFNNVFLQMGISSPVWLELLIKGIHGIVILLIVISLIGVIALIVAGAEIKSSGKKPLTSWFRKIFAKSKINEFSDTSRFYSIMELCTRCGLSMEKAFSFSEAMLTHPTIKNKVLHCVEEYSKGKAISEVIDDMQLLTHTESCLLHLGDQTGESAVVYKRISDAYMNKAEERINNTINLLEPLMVGIMCFMAGTVLLAFMLPLINIMLSIGGA